MVSGCYPSKTIINISCFNLLLLATWRVERVFALNLFGRKSLTTHNPIQEGDLQARGSGHVQWASRPQSCVVRLSWLFRVGKYPLFQVWEKSKSR